MRCPSAVVPNHSVIYDVSAFLNYPVYQLIAQQHFIHVTLCLEMATTINRIFFLFRPKISSMTSFSQGVWHNTKETAHCCVRKLRTAFKCLLLRREHYGFVRVATETGMQRVFPT
jgi:hypothetical protein